ncbi:hypothetical protein ACLOJK_008419 [Asimina triloba]
MDPEMINEVLSNKSGHYGKPKLSLINLISGGLVVLEGEKWAKHRRIINPAFHVGKLRGMLPAFSASCGELVDRWEQQISSNEFYELDVWPEMQALTGDVISRTAFGSSYEEGRQIFQLLTVLDDLNVQIFQKLYIPGYKYLPTKENLRRRELNREVRNILKHMIEEREKIMRAGGESKNDLLGLLMESNYIESQEEGVGLTIEEVIEECKLFYFAGQETTSSLLTWTMVLLAMHPSWPERAREEVLQVFQKNKPEFDGLNQLKTVTMILYEVLRLYPPVPGLLRCTRKKLQIRPGTTLPAEAQLLLPFLLAHHDPDLWGNDVEEFKPDRFIEGVSKATKNRVSLTPFGWGPRICIGQNFAMTEAKIAMAMILQHFTFELSPSYAHAPFTLATLRPQHGAQLILRTF